MKALKLVAVVVVMMVNGCASTGPSGRPPAGEVSSAVDIRCAAFDYKVCSRRGKVITSCKCVSEWDVQRRLGRIY